MQNICENIKNIKADIKEISKDFFLVSDEIKIIAVSKNQPVEKIVEAINCGQIDFAENYLQEAQEKWVELKKQYPQVRLHFIGHLQSNKVKKALELFDVIHCLDSVSLAKKIASTMAENNIENKSFLVQLCLDENSTTKHGVSAKNLPELLTECTNLNLDIQGLMVVAPLEDDEALQNGSQGIPVAPYFAFTKHLANEYGLNQLSMGMSADYKTALRFGSTMLRLGTSIFGNR